MLSKLLLLSTRYVAINYAVNNSCSISLFSSDVNDFESVTADLTFNPAGPSELCYDVPIVDDTKHEEPEEDFEGTIEVPPIDGVELGTPGTAELVIIDNDGE